MVDKNTKEDIQKLGKLYLFIIIINLPAFIGDFLNNNDILYYILMGISGILDLLFLTQMVYYWYIKPHIKKVN